MNKKFLNAVLFGALLASSAGTFTSCKDYDDDINGLSGRLDAVEKSITELNAKFGSLAYVKSVTFADGKLKVTDDKGAVTEFAIPDKDTNTTYSLAVSQNGNKATIILTGSDGVVTSKDIDFTDTKFDPSALKLGADGVTVEYNGVKTGITLPKTAGLTIMKLLGEDGVAYGWSIKYGDTEPTNLMISDVLPITGFSFIPDAFVGGVPSMKALSVEYKAWSGATSCDVPTTVGETWTKATATSYISPVIAGRYYLNPSSVTAAQITKIDVLSNDIQYITRTAECKPSVDRFEVADGILTVYFKANAELIKAVNADKITSLAIQVTTKAGNKITDEFRGLFATKYTNLILADKAKKARGKIYEHRLYGATSGKANDAIVAKPDYTVEYNSTLGLDIKPLVITCYDDAALSSGNDLTMSESEIDRLGLHYEFHLCNYIGGDNGTKQNDFAKIEGSTLFPKLFNETGTPYAAVGRMPLVRVQLLTKDNKVVSTGWIKVEITKDRTPAKDIEFDFGSFTNQCPDENFKLSVEQMNVKIYNAVGLDRNEFNRLYTIKNIATDPLINYGKGDGIVTLESDPVAPIMTDLLSWNLTQADMALALARTTNAGKLETVVTYVANDPKTRGDVTITFKAEVNAISAVTIPATNKIKEYWDANKEYIRLNVAVPDGSNSCTFATELNNVFVGNKPVIEGANSYYYVFDAVKNARTDVEGMSGTTYDLSVSADGLTLKADAADVAVINKATGVVTYQNTAAAKDLLNIASHSSVPNAGFYAWIDVKATTGTCDLELPITNGQFKAYFLRPINVAAGTGKFQDAVDDGSTVKKLDLLKFTDWRDYEFSASKSKTYFTFYGISNITVDIAKITTDLNNGDINTQLLSSVTTKLEISQTPTAVPGTPDYGTVTYKNNGAAIGAFNLRLPVKITYLWGTVKAYVIIPVEKTQGN